MGIPYTTPLLALLVVIVLGGSHTAAYLYGGSSCETKYANEQSQLVEDYNKLLANERKKNEEISKQLADKQTEVRTVTKTVTKYVTKEIEKPVYRECIVPPSGVSTINETATKYNSARTGNHSSNPN